MAIITAIADGESGASVRGKLNDVHDEIVETTVGAFAHVVTNDIIIYTATATPGTVLLIAAASANKKLLIYNAIASTMDVTVDSDGSDTIDGVGDVILTPGTSILISPLTGGWESLQEGAGVLSVVSGTNISVDDTDPANPIVNLPSSISGQTVNDVTLGNIGPAQELLNFAGNYEKILSTTTLFISTTADLPNATGPAHPFSNVHVVFLESLSVDTGNTFDIGSGVTFEQSARSTITITFNSSGTAMDFSTASGAADGERFQMDNMTLRQSGTGALLDQNLSGSVVLMRNVDAGSNTGAAGSGDILLNQGQLFHPSDGILRGGASVVVNDMDNIIYDETFLILSGRDNQRCTEFMPGSTCSRLDATTFTSVLDAFGGLTGSHGFYFAATAAVTIFNHMNGGFRPIDVTSSAITVEDPAAVGFGVIAGNTFFGDGSLYTCIPTVIDSTVNLFSLRGCAVDANNNLIGVEQGPSNIYRYAGLTSTIVDTMTLTGTPTNVTWYRGSLVHLDAADEEMMIEDGFPNGPSAPTATVDLTALTPPLNGGRGVANDGTRFFIAGPVAGSVHVFGSDFFTATTPVQLFSFIVDGAPGIQGMDYDGVNLIVVDTVANEVIVLKGVSSTVQYKFSTADGDPVAIAISHDGFVISDSGSDNMSIFNSSPTLDHSSPTWEVIGNTGPEKIVESSAKGGVVFDDSTARVLNPALSDGVVADITDGGVNLIYAPFTQRENAFMSNENLGVITITSARDRGQTFQGSFTATTLAPGTNKYELLIVINGEPQEDSVGSNIWIGNGDIKTITSQPITRDVTDTDEVKLGLRPAGNSVNLGVLRSAFSHNG